MRDLPEWATDAIHTVTTVQFDWRDRLRILFGSRVEVRVRTDCENRPGRMESESSVLVFRLRPASGMLGMVEATPEAEVKCGE